jgi:hypothetical protein
MRHIYLPFFLICFLVTHALHAQNVGIGQPLPQSKLDIDGGVTVGETYSGSNAAPSNGAIFEGQIGIGTTSPATSVKLDVRGKTYIEGNADVGAGAAKIDLAVDDNNTGLESPKDGRLDLYTDSTSLVKLNGNVGNGSPDEGLIYNDPGENLDVRISGDTSVNTSFKDLFLADADSGRIGIKQAKPQVDFHLSGQGDGDQNDENSPSYVAFISNGDMSDRKRDGMTISLVGSTLGTSNEKDFASSNNNFLTFNFNGTPQGAIEGTNATNRAVTLTSGGADYAEWLARKHTAEEMEAGDIVAIKDGQITKNTGGKAQYSVVSYNHVVLGNTPPSPKFDAGLPPAQRTNPSKGNAFANTTSSNHDRLQRSDGEPVSFMGQVEVKVRGEVAPYDYIVPSGNHNGVGKAVSPAQIAPGQFNKVVGVAWEGSQNTGVAKVNCFISQAMQYHGPVSQAQDSRKVEEHKKKLQRQKQVNEQLKEDIKAIRERVSDLENTQ